MTVQEIVVLIKCQISEVEKVIQKDNVMLVDSRKDEGAVKETRS